MEAERPKANCMMCCEPLWIHKDTGLELKGVAVTWDFGNSVLGFSRRTVGNSNLSLHKCQGRRGWKWVGKNWFDLFFHNDR